MSSKFKPSVSTVARRTIKIAFEDLDRTITPVDSQDFPATTLQHVQKAALDIENQLAARQSLRNMRRLMPLFRGLEHYSKVVDVLCNGTPYLAWIWAPITLILRVASEYVEAFEHIMKGYSRISESLVRFEILDNTFASNHEFQQTLAVFYADILQFHKYAYSFVRRSSWKLIFLTSWGRFQRRFDNIMEDLDRHGTLIDQEANARNISESRQQRQHIENWREESLESLNRQEDEQAAKEYRYITSWLKADETEQLTIHDIASSDGEKYPGTCTWILKNQKLISWLRRDTTSSLCWLQGIPGSGKTVLSAQLLTFIKSDNQFVVHHFMNPSYATSTCYEHVLRSLLLQLLRKDNNLAAHVYNDYVLAKKAPTVLTMEQLVKTLFTATSHKPRQTQYIWILIDGFDACESSKQASLISLMTQLVSKNSQSGGTVCKVLVSSRASPMLSKRFRKAQIVSLTEEKRFVELAIKEYTSQRLDILGDKFGQLHLGPSDLKEIQAAVAQKADGMFLYARLILDYVEKKIFYSGDEVKRSIDDLPEELSQFYGKILSQILVRLDDQSVDRVRSLFGWIAFAKRPLKRLELLSAITFSSAEPEVSYLVPDFVLIVCAALIEERPDSTLAFIHLTVKEFLRSPSSNLELNETECMIEHGIASITCLISGVQIFRDGTSDHSRNLRVVMGLHGFHLYAADHWVEYLLAAIRTAASSNINKMQQLAILLADKVEEIENNLPLDVNREDLGITDERLTLLPPNIQLQNLVKTVLTSESEKTLGLQLFLPADSEGVSRRRDSIQPRDVLHVVLEAYQKSVRFLLEQDYYPGISSEELVRFKSQFHSSAFTCRLRTCRYADLGFESEGLRDEHEMVHARRIPCTFPDCKHPPLVSLSTLKRHINKHHLVQPPRKPIRNLEHLPTSRKLTEFSNLESKLEYYFPEFTRHDITQPDPRAFHPAPVKVTQNLEQRVQEKKLKQQKRQTNQQHTMGAQSSSICYQMEQQKQEQPKLRLTIPGSNGKADLQRHYAQPHGYPVQETQDFVWFDQPARRSHSAQISVQTNQQEQVQQKAAQKPTPMEQMEIWLSLTSK